MTYLDGEGPVTREEARERVKGWYDDDKHKPKKDKEKREDALDDPAHIEGDEE